MDVDKTIALTEKYLREFILFLLSFFTNRSAGELDDYAYEDVNRSVMFSILSAGLGAYMWDRYILRLSGKQADMIGLLTDNLLRWASIGLVLYLVFRAFRVRVPIIAPVLSALKVYAVSHVVAIYSAYVIINILWVFTADQDYAATAQSNAFKLSYLIQLLLLLSYFPREIASIAPEGTSPWRWRGIAVLFSLFVTVLVLLRFATYQYELADLPDYSAAPHPAEKGAASK
ncbi:MAG: hypothetical protein ACKOVA_11420 [Novosphingobium sp.]